MPWTTPTLLQVRKNARGYIMAALPGADALVPNSNMRVIADMDAGLAHENHQHLDWVADQLLPVTNEAEFLDRWAFMYLVNADNSRGRKMATFASGTGTAVGTIGAIIPAGTLLSGGNSVDYQTTQQATIGGDGTTTLNLTALTAGTVGNLDTGSMLGGLALNGVTTSVTIITMDNGVDTETDDELRTRLLARLVAPPMGGSAADWVAWTLDVPGVTRAWAAPNELAVGTMTVRFMCDDSRAYNGGFPIQDDINAVTAFLNTKRPVTVKDWWVVAPIPQPINFTITNLEPDDNTTRQNIIASVNEMLFERARPAAAQDGVLIPAQTIYAAWVSAAILNTPGVESFDLVMADAVMPSDGFMGVLGTVSHG
jgi:uncharacterized phage protein gp47/JayE